MFLLAYVVTNVFWRDDCFNGVFLREENTAFACDITDIFDESQWTQKEKHTLSKNRWIKYY